MPRSLLVLLVVVLALSPAAPTTAQPADSTGITDSLQVALDRFERAEPPTTADSAALRRWADSVQVRGESWMRSAPTQTHQYARTLRRAYRELSDSAGVARSTNIIGYTYFFRGRYEEALARFREANNLLREIGDREEISFSQIGIGNVHRLQNRYEKALSHYREGLEIRRELGDRQGVASVLMNLGLVHWNQGRYRKALAHYQESLTLNKKIGNRAGIANVLSNSGLIYLNQNRPEEALARFRKSLEIYRDIGYRSGTASALINIGFVHKRRGRYELALTNYQKSLEILREIGERRQISLLLNNFAEVHRERGQAEEALLRYRRALEINREINYPKGTANSLEYLGAVHLTQGRPQAAIDTLGQSVRVAEKLRLNVTSPEARRSFLSTQIDAYQALTTAHVRSGQPDSALRSAEQARARLLADRLAGTATGDTSFAAPAIADLRRTLDSNEAALLYTNAGSKWPLTALVVTRDTTVARELPDSTVRAAIEDEYPTRLNRLRREEGPLTAALGNDPSQGNGTTPSLAEIVRLYRYYLTREQPNPSIQNDLSRRLHSLLVEPIAEAIEQKSELITVPTGALGYLPFETLQDDSGRHLIEKKRVRYAQSLTVLRQLQRRDYAERERPLLALGGASYTSDETAGSDPLIAEARRGSTLVATDEHASTLLRDADRRLEQGKSPRLTYQQLGYQAWSDLPGTQSEVDQLSTIAGEGARVLTGAGASEDSVRALDEKGQLRSYRHVHFATHGVAVPETPKLSALVLSQTNASDSLAARDGYLTMEEIAGLKMRADVAVLSACQSGLGKVVAGEGVVSLSHAFLRAGANATLVSQWKVLDESTRQFMTAVYERANDEGTSFAEAVTETKRAFIEGEHGEKNTDPLRWAPFVYYGRE